MIQSHNNSNVPKYRLMGNLHSLVDCLKMLTFPNNVFMKGKLQKIENQQGVEIVDEANKRAKKV